MPDITGINDIRRGKSSDPKIVFIDYKDTDYESRYEEEREFITKRIEEYGIQNYVIFFVDLKIDLEILRKLVLNEKPILVVPYGKILSKISKQQKRLNYISDYQFFSEVDPLNKVVKIPVITTISPWALVLHPYDQSNFKIFDEGMNLVARTSKFLLECKDDYLKIDELKKENAALEKIPNPEKTLDQQRLFYQNNIKIDEISKRTGIDNLQLVLCGSEDINAESEIITSYNQFEDFCNREIDKAEEVGYDVETNALERMDIHHEIIGFSLATAGTNGCYVPLKSIDFIMPPEDKEKIIEKLKQILLNKTIWVYNCQHEIPVTYNNYGIFLKDIKDLYVIVKLLNCGKKWENGNRSLKYQVSHKLNKKDWSVDLDQYRELFGKLNKDENIASMKILLSKYYKEDEIDDILNKVIQRYKELNEAGQISNKIFLSYEHIPYKLIGKYGSLDSSSLFLLKEHYAAEIEDKNQIHGIDLWKGFDLWSKVHIAHVIMEMNGFYFNDKKAEKLNVWINENLIRIMDYFVKSDLVKDWIRNKNYLYIFSHDYLMMNCIDELIDREKEAKVLPSKNAITKDHIKVYKMTKEYLETLQGVNASLVRPYNLALERGINLNNDELISEFLHSINCDVYDSSIRYMRLFNTVYQGKPASYFIPEFSKDGFILKIGWEQLLLIYIIFSNIYDEDKELINRKYREWLEERLKTVTTFEDYKELFNVNSTTKDFRDYISNILLQPDVRLGHTYYKFYELYESADFDSFLEESHYVTYKNTKTGGGPIVTNRETDIYHFLIEYQKLIESTKDVEVFSPERLDLFKDLYLRYENVLLGDKYKYLDKRVKECLEWVHDKHYTLSSLDSKMLEELTQIYSMIHCDVDKPETWTEEFKFMFNYKFIKKLLKAKTTYIYGSTSRQNCWYVPKYYYKEGQKFPKRLMHYKYGSDLNKIYDLDSAIQIELENGTTKIFTPDEEVELVSGEKKLAKDLLPNDDIVIHNIEDKVEEELDEDNETEPEPIEQDS